MALAVLDKGDKPGMMNSGVRERMIIEKLL